MATGFIKKLNRGPEHTFFRLRFAEVRWNFDPTTLHCLRKYRLGNL